MTTIINEPAMDSLRIAATLTHSLPQLRARVRRRSAVDLIEQVVIDVVADHRNSVLRGSGNGISAAMSPCEFRQAVAHELQAQISADELNQTLASVLGPDPTVEVALPAGGLVRPGGIYRVPVQGRWFWAMATTLNPHVAFELGRPIVESAFASLDVRALGVRPDPATGVSLAFAETCEVAGSSAEEALIETFEELLSCWATVELIDAVQAVEEQPLMRRPRRDR